MYINITFPRYRLYHGKWWFHYQQSYLLCLWLYWNIIKGCNYTLVMWLVMRPVGDSITDSTEPDAVSKRKSMSVVLNYFGYKQKIIRIVIIRSAVLCYGLSLRKPYTTVTWLKCWYVKLTKYQPNIWEKTLFFSCVTHTYGNYVDDTQLYVLIQIMKLAPCLSIFFWASFFIRKFWPFSRAMMT